MAKSNSCCRALSRLELSVLVLISTVILSENLCFGQQTTIEQDNNPYRHVKTLDPEGKYRLEWLVDWERNRIFFNVTVETLGWVGFGISKHPEMDGADLIMGGVNSRRGRGRENYFTDRYGIGNQVPIVDVKQDWILHSAWQSYTHTFLSFSRPFDTCDQQDIPINDDTLYLLWSYGQTDDTTEYHSANRGSVPMHLRDPDLTPRRIQEGGDADIQIGGSDVEIWSLQSTFRIPPKRTTYHCTIRKLELPRKHHVIGYTFKINNETQSNMHHMLLFRCIINNPEAVFERFVNHPGEECYSQSRQLGEIPFQSCIELKVGHAIGGHDVFFPETMGVPIGATGRNEYYLLQTHYDNPTSRGDLVSEFQLNVYHTSKLRPNDGGVLSIGQNIPGAPSILIPPRSPDHRIYGHCSSDCTRKMLPPNGIKLIGALLHTHNTGRRITFQHFRANRELTPIFNDDNYIPTFQPTRMLRNEVTILPGDHVDIRCHFDTSHLNRTVIGSYGADAEMCKAFVPYYSLLQEYPICRSELTSPAYVARYFAGTTNITWDQSRLEYEATAPPHLAGMTLTEISDSPYVNWSIAQRARLQRDHFLHPQVEICPSVVEIEAASRGVMPQPTFVTYPIQASQYRPPQQCRLFG